MASFDWDSESVFEQRFGENKITSDFGSNSSAGVAQGGRIKDSTENYRRSKIGNVVSDASGNQRRMLDGDKKFVGFPDFVPSLILFQTAQGSGAYSPVFATTRLLIQSVNENRGESVHIVNTFSDDNDVKAYFSGEAPKVYSIGGTLLHADHVMRRHINVEADSSITPESKPDFNWYNSFRYLYDNLLRGTKCAEKKLRARLSYNYQWIEGYVLSFSTNFTISSDQEVPFSMGMLVLKDGTFHPPETISAKSIVDDVSSRNVPIEDLNTMASTSEGEAAFYWGEGNELVY